MRKLLNSGRPLAAFNVVDFAMAQGAVRAASTTGVHTIIQFSMRTVRHFGAETLARAVKTLAARWNASVYVHLDHCTDEDVLHDAVSGGFDGIMVDGSHLDFDDNVQFTREWVARAHAAGMVVEGELGAISGVEDGTTSGVVGARYDADELRAFVERTGVDLIGTDIGTAHGLYDEPPDIDFPLIERVIPDLSAGFVVHGASGLSDELLNRFAKVGVAKVNFSTDLKIAWGKAMRASLDAGGMPEPLMCSHAAERAVFDICIRKISALHGLPWGWVSTALTTGCHPFSERPGVEPHHS